MASHHHCHQQQQTTCYSDCCTCNCSPQQDPLLLQALASQLLQHQQSQQTHQYLHNPHHQHQQQNQHKYHKHSHQDQQQRNQGQQVLLLNSLLKRIEALESSLKHVSSSKTTNKPSPSAKSLREFAARTIQIHFRAFLVRRSRTLRNLKHLAIIKSSFNSLKALISDKPYFNHQVVSEKAMDLLHKLDSIQGGDPMIRDGKRAICRELVQILEYIDEMSIRRKQIYSNTMKKVRFAEDNHGYRACNGGNETFHDEDAEDLEEKGASVSSDDQRELIDALCKKIENIEGFTRVYEDDEEESTSSKLNHENRSPTSDLKTDFGNGKHFEGINGNPFYSAPMPVQMEPMREDLTRKEKIVRVAR
ncbi:hypothetical protein ACHQM5_006516 [Ranunculus cassubicifolius]